MINDDKSIMLAIPPVPSAPSSWFAFHPSSDKTLLLKVRPPFYVEPDELPPAPFKFGATDIPILCLFYLTFLKLWHFPQWKTSSIVPYHKDGSNQDPSNYEPIITPRFLTYYGKISKNKLPACSLNHDLINSSQHTFL